MYDSFAEFEFELVSNKDNLRPGINFIFTYLPQFDCIAIIYGVAFSLFDFRKRQ
jgi:hypothetical protein